MFCCIIVTVDVCVVSALECYTCRNQDSNREKCIKTSKQCEEYADACMSIVKWQSM